MNKKKVLWSIVLMLFVSCGAFAGYYIWKTNNAVSSIPRESLLPERTPATSGTPTPTETTPDDPAEGMPLNVLLLGSDSRGSGDPGRSDTMMLAHIPANRSHMYLISIPRDLYVDIPGHSPNKVNAAYALGGAPLTVSTLEGLYGVSIDHVVKVDFNGFIGLVDAVGGVDVQNPFTGCDTSNNNGYCWKKGKVHLTSDDALRYVRWRKGLPEGDINRTENQQRVVKAIVAKALNGGATSSPQAMLGFIEQVAKFVTVDDTLTNSRMLGIALGMRVGSSEDIRTMTNPVGEMDEISRAGFIFHRDLAKQKELNDALRGDTMDSYWTEHH